MLVRPSLFNETILKERVMAVLSSALANDKELSLNARHLYIALLKENSPELTTLMSVLKKLTQPCHEFLLNHPEYVLVLLKRVETDIRSYQNEQYADGISNPAYSKYVKGKITNNEYIKKMPRVFAVITDLFENIKATLEDEKYQESNDYHHHFLFHISQYLKVHCLTDVVKTAIIQNLLFSYPSPEIDIIDSLEAYNVCRSFPKKKSKIERLRIAMEELIRLAHESGFKLETFYNLDSGIQLNIYPHQSTAQATLGPAQYMFNAEDRELNEFSRQFMEDFDQAIVGYNVKPENANKQFTVGSRPNISFFRIYDNKQQREYILVALSKTCVKTEKNILREHVLAFTKEFVSNYNNHPNYNINADIVLVDPERHAVKSVIPLLWRYASMTKDEVQMRLHLRTHQNNQLHVADLIDHFKECSEIYGISFMSRMVRMNPDDIVFKSASNHYFKRLGERFDDHKTMCENCQLKTKEGAYLRQAVIAKIVGKICLDLGLDHEHSHSEAADIKLVTAFNRQDNENLAVSPVFTRRQVIPMSPSTPLQTDRPVRLFETRYKKPLSPIKRLRESGMADDDEEFQVMSISPVKLQPRAQAAMITPQRNIVFDMDALEDDHSNMSEKSSGSPNKM